MPRGSPGEEQRAEDAIFQPKPRRALAQRIELECLAELIVRRAELRDAPRMQQALHLDRERVGTRLLLEP